MLIIPFFCIISNKMNFLNLTLRLLNNFIQPNYCPICLKMLPYDYKGTICSRCEETIEENLPPFCQRCGRSLLNTASYNGLCKSCLFGGWEENLRVFYPFKYTGAIKELIHKFKYDGMKNLANFFGERLYLFAREFILPFYQVDFICYVPLHPKKLREREFNQAHLLAKELARKTRMPILENLLFRHKYTRPQSELSGEERQTNVKGAFRLNPKYKEELKNSHLLLIDDIITTGSTLKECVKELKIATCKVVALTIAGG